jgi:Asparagine synthase (glutamine-hydrolyzing)
MCGIAGIVALTDTGRQQVSKLRQSIRTLQTRGPDERAFIYAKTWAWHNED